MLGGCESRPIPWLAAPAAPGTPPPLAADSGAAAPPDTLAAVDAEEPALAEDEPKAAPPPPYQMVAEDTLRYRRYVGWLGPRPVVVELFVEQEGRGRHQVSGRYYDARTGAGRQFSAVDFTPGRPVPLQTAGVPDSAEHWQLPPLGAALAGTVTTLGQPLRRFTLREDYRQAALAVCSAVMYGRSVRAYGQEHEPEPRQYQSYYRRQYIQLKGLAARRPALQRAFPSRATQVRAWLRRGFEEEGADLLQIEDYEFALTLNDYDLLSYTRTVSTYADGANHPDSDSEEFSYDLRTGRRLSLATLLRRGSGPALKRLALRYIDQFYLHELREWHNDPQYQIEELDNLDQTKYFSLTPTGLGMTMRLGPHALGPTTIEILYAALRPLLRPRTPLNRLLVARGLPPVR